MYDFANIETMTVSFEVPKTIGIRLGKKKEDRVVVKLNLSEIHESWLQRAVIRGLPGMLNDDCSASADKEGDIRAVVADIEAGKGYSGRVVGMRKASGDPIEAQAVKFAKEALKEAFKELNIGKNTVADWARDESTKVFFKDDAKTWDNDVVIRWMDSDLRDRNFREEAEEHLAKLATATSTETKEEVKALLKF